MTVAVSGSRGLVGAALVPALVARGHRVIRLVRAPGSSSGETVAWDPFAEVVDLRGLEGVDGVVHLAGENIAARRWTARQKSAIRDSRVVGTRGLAMGLAKLSSPPSVLVCASAIGYYGDRGEEWLQEESRPGQGFLADACQAWEAAADPARARGIRTVHLRFGVILTVRGGALAKMLPPFRFGLGGRLGTGRQYMSWIALEDAVGVIVHALESAALQGPVNAVSPTPVTNQEFTQALGRALRRPTICPVPSLAIRVMFGEMADAVLLSSARVAPTRLTASGYGFRYPALEPALQAILRPSPSAQFA